MRKSRNKEGIGGITKGGRGFGDADGPQNKLCNLRLALSHQLSKFSVLHTEYGFEHGGGNKRKDAQSQAVEQQLSGLNVSDAPGGDFGFNLLKKMGKQTLNEIFLLEYFGQKPRVLRQDIQHKKGQTLGFQEGVHIDADERADAFFEGGVRREGDEEARIEFVDGFGANGFEEVFLGAEIIVEQGEVAVGLLRNFAHACAVVAARNEDFHGRGDDFFFRRGSKGRFRRLSHLFKTFVSIICLTVNPKVFSGNTPV